MPRPYRCHCCETGVYGDQFKHHLIKECYGVTDWVTWPELGTDHRHYTGFAGLGAVYYASYLNRQYSYEYKVYRKNQYFFVTGRSSQDFLSPLQLAERLGLEID